MSTDAENGAPAGTLTPVVAELAAAMIYASEGGRTTLAGPVLDEWRARLLPHRQRPDLATELVVVALRCWRVGMPAVAAQVALLARELVGDVAVADSLERAAGPVDAHQLLSAAVPAGARPPAPVGPVSAAGVSVRRPR